MKQRLAAAKKKMQDALDKVSKPKQTLSQKAAAMPGPTPKVATVSMVQKAVAAAPVVPTTTETVSKKAYSTVMSTILEGPQANKAQVVKQVNEALKKYASAPAQKVAAEQSTEQEEPEGFIGKYSKKIEQETQQMVQDQTVEVIKDKVKGKPYSVAAPKHKGLLARAQEKEEKEQEERDEREKQALMQEALNDPEFKSKMESL